MEKESQDKTAYNAYMSEYMTARYHRRRNEYIEKLGGVCVDCGTDEMLEFDHIDASTKEYDIGKIMSTGSNTKVEAEVAKCALRCKTCHRTKTVRENDDNHVGHGEGLTGKRNCLCDLCRELKNAYKREWKRKKKMGL